MPIVEKAAALPDDIEASNAAFHHLLTFIPANQPPFYDEDGKVNQFIADNPL
ncbi:MAG: hypothetical protein OHK0046_17650 [Anaerolineae bacterium]